MIFTDVVLLLIWVYNLYSIGFKSLQGESTLLSIILCFCFYEQLYVVTLF